MRTGSRNASYKSDKKFLSDFKAKMGIMEDSNGIIIYEDKHKKEHMEDIFKKII